MHFFAAARQDHMETLVNEHKQYYKKSAEIMPGRSGKGKNWGKDRHCNLVRKIPENIGTEL